MIGKFTNCNTEFNFNGETITHVHFPEPATLKCGLELSSRRIQGKLGEKPAVLCPQPTNIHMGKRLAQVRKSCPMPRCFCARRSFGGEAGQHFVAQWWWVLGKRAEETGLGGLNYFWIATTILFFIYCIFY